jgi:hypothetical protein
MWYQPPPPTGGCGGDLERRVNKSAFDERMNREEKVEKSGPNFKSTPLL